VHQLYRNGRLFPPNYLHDSWLDYLYRTPRSMREDGAHPGGQLVNFT
jgi:hypothetical protein